MGVQFLAPVVTAAIRRRRDNAASYASHHLPPHEHGPDGDEEATIALQDVAAMAVGLLLGLAPFAILVRMATAS